MIRVVWLAFMRVIGLNQMSMAGRATWDPDAK